MNQVSTLARRLIVAAVMVAMLALPSVASAGKRDRDRDGVPDRWAVKNGLSGKNRAAKKDPDRDGLNNRAEFRSRTHPRRADTDRDGVGDADEDRDRDGVDNGNEAREHTHPCRRDSDRDGTDDGHEDADEDRLNNGGEDDADTDPVDPDSDGDGIKDGDEGAGSVVSYADGILTIRLFGGATLSGVVDDITWIDCDEPADDSSAGVGAARDGGDDDYSDDSKYDDSDDGYGSDDDEWYDEDEDDLGGCSPDVLQPGARVEQALVSLTPDGAVFEEIVLAR